MSPDISVDIKIYFLGFYFKIEEKLVHQLKVRRMEDVTFFPHFCFRWRGGRERHSVVFRVLFRQSLE